MTLSLLAVGRSGAGKSTIGNLIFTGEPEGIFETSSNPHSCTDKSLTKTGTCQGVEVSYTDTPGIPDTDPKMNKKFYDAIIHSIRKVPLSAILFVFPYGRIDPDLYQKSAILFREIKKAKCLKILIINDRENRFKRLSEAQYDELAGSITDYTQVDFVLYKDCCYIDTHSMVDKLQTLVTRLHAIQPTLSSNLRTFTELVHYTNKAKSEFERREDAKQRIQEEIEELKRTEMLLRNVALYGGAEAVWKVTFSLAMLSPSRVARAAKQFRNAIQAAKTRSRLVNELPQLQNLETITAQMVQEALEEIEEEQDHFRELCAALDTPETAEKLRIKPPPTKPKVPEQTLESNNSSKLKSSSSVASTSSSTLSSSTAPSTTAAATTATTTTPPPNLSLMAIGHVGAGKSTIGNVMLTGVWKDDYDYDTNDDHHDVPFATTSAENPSWSTPTKVPYRTFSTLSISTASNNRPKTAITTKAVTKSGTCAGFQVTYTDTPGIPSVGSDGYDQVVTAIRNQPLSAMLFVFPYGATDHLLFRRTEILFREFQKTKCVKVLIIYDMTSSARPSPLTEEQFDKFAAWISAYTKMKYDICYKDCCYLDQTTTMADKLQTLVRRLSAMELPLVLSTSGSTELRTMKEMEDYIHRAKAERNRVKTTGTGGGFVGNLFQGGFYGNKNNNNNNNNNNSGSNLNNNNNNNNAVVLSSDEIKRLEENFHVLCDALIFPVPKEKK